MSLKSVALAVAAIAAFICLDYIYLYPGSKVLFEGRTDQFMSDGTDPTSYPRVVDQVVKTWHEHPSRFIYGSVYIDSGDPERGVAFVMPWDERWLIVLTSYIVPTEQVYSAVVFCLLLLNGLCMYLLAAYLGWSRPVSYGLAIAWAFNTFTRARAKVHGSMVGIYHLPLIFLALFMIVRGKSWRSLAGAALALFLAGMTLHYFLVFCVFLSPFFLAFVFIQPEFCRQWKRISLRLAIAVAPVLLMLGLNYVCMVPSDARISTADVEDMGTIPGGVHPFLRIYYARLIDYLGGDLLLDRTAAEINPLRSLVNGSILHELSTDQTAGNLHERTNGIRWTILILSAIALYYLARGRIRGGVGRNVTFFAIFGLFCLWLSLSPDIPCDLCSPGYLLHRLIPKIRVLNRSGVNVRFSLLMITGYFLSTKPDWRKFQWIFPLLLLVDYLPLQNEPLAPIYPAYSQLQREKGPCGPGTAFPFISPFNGLDWWDNNIFTQRMRGSDCTFLNEMSDMKQVAWLTRRFPPTRDYVQGLQQGSFSADIAADSLQKLVNCVPLNWIVFLDATPKDWAAKMCNRLGWTMYPDNSCIAPDKGRPLKTYPDQCTL